MRLVEERVHLGLGPLPDGEVVPLVGVQEAELLRHLLLRRVLRLDVQLVQDGQRGLSRSKAGVRRECYKHGW